MLAAVREAGITEITVDSVGLTRPLPSDDEYVRHVVPGAKAVVPSHMVLSPNERGEVIRIIPAQLLPQVGHTLTAMRSTS